MWHKRKGKGAAGRSSTNYQQFVANVDG